MAVSVSSIRPVAHLPLILGMLRKLDVASIIDDLLPPNPANMLSCGRGVEALVLAILDGHHVLYKVGAPSRNAVGRDCTSMNRTLAIRGTSCHGRHRIS